MIYSKFQILLCQLVLNYQRTKSINPMPQFVNPYGFVVHFSNNGTGEAPAGFAPERPY